MPIVAVPIVAVELVEGAGRLDRQRRVVTCAQSLFAFAMAIHDLGPPQRETERNSASGRSGESPAHVGARLVLYSEKH